MHQTDFNRSSMLCRGAIMSLWIYSLLLVTAGCQQKSPPADTPEPKPAVEKSMGPEASKAAQTPEKDQTLETQAGSSEPPAESGHQVESSSPTMEAGVDDGDGQPESTSELRLTPPPNRNTDTDTKTDMSAKPASEELDEATGSPDVGETMAEMEEEYEIDPEILAHIEAQERAMRRIADTYAAPPGAKQLGKLPDLWVDMKAKRVYVDGYVTMRRGPLEMFACPVGTKEHESVVAVFAKSSEVHAALLAIGAQSGTPVRWNPDFLPPTGQTITVWATWRDPKPSSAPEPTDQPEFSSIAAEFVPSDEFHAVDAREWVRNMKTKTELSEPWVFAGSTFWSDPEDNIEHYSADAGDMICVSNFTSAMLDVPFKSSADAGNLLFEPFSERIPERGTPVRLVLVPQPLPSDHPAEPLPVDPKAAPEKSMLPIAERGKPDAAKPDAARADSAEPTE